MVSTPPGSPNSAASCDEGKLVVPAGGWRRVLPVHFAGPPRPRGAAGDASELFASMRRDETLMERIRWHAEALGSKSESSSSATEYATDSDEERAIYGAPVPAIEGLFNEMLSFIILVRQPALLLLDYLVSDTASSHCPSPCSSVSSIPSFS
ncbi:hypothetical protein DIPPA_22868 [Diplonema papillatum]|nr:hypothetical protein DIPPA_22868 [Diplonema papillatum]